MQIVNTRTLGRAQLQSAAALLAALPAGCPSTPKALEEISALMQLPALLLAATQEGAVMGLGAYNPAMKATCTSCPPGGGPRACGWVKGGGQGARRLNPCGLVPTMKPLRAKPALPW